MILIVDRNPHVREFLGREYRNRGYVVREAGTREEMEHLLSGTPPHLLVVDPDLPTRGGAGMVSELRKAYPELAMVLHGHGADRLGPQEPGLVELVEKSGRIDALDRAVGRVLTRLFPEGHGGEDAHV